MFPLAAENPTTWNAVAWFPDLLGLYWVLGVVGGGLILISMIFGADTDTEVDADFDGALDGMDGALDGMDGAEIDADFSGDVDGVELEQGADALHHGAEVAGGLASWLSMRFMVYFCATFGGFGLILTYTSSLSHVAIAVISLVAGIALGQLAHQIIRFLVRTSGNSKTSDSDFVDRPGRVTIAMEQGRVGEIALSVRGSDRYIRAKSARADEQLAVGDEVFVIEYNAGMAKIVTRKEYEFTKGKGTA